MDSLPNLDKTEMKETLIKVLNDDMIRKFKIMNKIKSNVETMIDG